MLSVALLVATGLLSGAQESTPASLSTGLEHFRAGRLVEAERAFTETLSSAPGHPAASLYLARIYSRGGRSAEAENVLKEALSSRPRGIGLLNELGLLFLELERYRDAEEAFSRALAVRPENVRAIGGLAESRFALGREDEALALVESAAAAAPEDPTLHWLAAGLLMRREQYARALAAVERALAGAGSSSATFGARAEAERARGFLLMELNRDAEASEVLADVTAREPENAQAWVALGRIHFRRGSLDRARAAFDRAVASDPTSDAALVAAGEVALMELRFDDAVAHLERALDAAPQSIDARRKMAEALWKLGRHADARARLEEAITLACEPDARSLYLLAQVLRDGGNPGDAVPHLLEARRLRPGHAPTRYLLGVTLASLDREEEARGELETFRRLKAFELEAEAHERALLERPDDVASFRALVDLYFEHGRARDALPLLQKAVSLSAEDAGLHYRLATALHEDGRERSATEAFERAVALDPDHALRRRVEEALGRGSGRDPGGM